MELTLKKLAIPPPSEEEAALGPVLFWRPEKDPHGEFSNWLPAPMLVKEQRYSCVEQYMMHQKALLFDDPTTAAKIMKTGR